MNMKNESLYSNLVSMTETLPDAAQKECIPGLFRGYSDETVSHKVYMIVKMGKGTFAGYAKKIIRWEDGIVEKTRPSKSPEPKHEACLIFPYGMIKDAIRLNDFRTPMAWFGVLAIIFCLFIVKAFAFMSKTLTFIPWDSIYPSWLSSADHAVNSFFGGISPRFVQTITDHGMIIDVIGVALAFIVLFMLIVSVIKLCGAIANVFYRSSNRSALRKAADFLDMQLSMIRVELDASLPGAGVTKKDTGVSEKTKPIASGEEITSGG